MCAAPLPTFAQVQQHIRANRFVVASVDPAFPALFQDWRTGRLAAALRDLGFTAVHEAAEAIPAVGRAVRALGRKDGILPNCPAVVNYVEQYYPELTDRLLPVASPMIVHGRMLRREYGKGAVIVYIGPCSAKVHEARRPENAGVVDCVITFQELLGWIAREHRDMAALEEVPFDCVASLSGEEAAPARMAALEGGVLHSCGYSWDPGETEAFSLSGTQDVTDFLTQLRKESQGGALAEPLLCHGGCCNGPNFPRRGDTFVARRAAVLRYARSAPALEARAAAADVSAAAAYAPRPYVPPREVRELEIAAILKKAGAERFRPAVQLRRLRLPDLPGSGPSPFWRAWRSRRCASPICAPSCASARTASWRPCPAAWSSWTASCASASAA